MAQNMHFDITGDCSGAIAALSNTESAVDRLAGMDAAVGVQVRGAPSAVSQLQAVGAAAQAASADISVGADTRDLAGAQRTVSALRGEIAGMSRDIGSVGGLDVGVSGAGDIQKMAGAVRGLGGAFGDATSAIEDYANSGSSAAGVSSQMERGMSTAQRATEGHTAALSDHRAEVQGLTGDYRELASVGAGAQNAAAGASGAAGGVPNPGRQSIQRVQRQFNANQRASGGSFLLRTAANPNATPPGGSPGGPPGGGGGGGGGSGGSGGSGSGGRGAGAKDDRRGRFGGLHSAVQPLQMGALVGAVEPLIAGAAGFMAVNEAIKNNPLLAAAATAAMGQYKSGITEASQAVTGAALPAMQALGNTMHGFGRELGSLGAEHMMTGLAGADVLAGTATQALKNLDPAIDSSMKALVSLGDAAMNGIGNPNTVQAIKGVADTMSDPKNEAGMTNLASSIGTVSAAIGTVAVNAGGLAGNILGGGGSEGEGPGLGAGLGAYVGKKTLGGMLSKNMAGADGVPRTIAGGLSAAATGAGIFAQATADQQSGVDPTPGVVGGVAGGGLAAMAGAGGPMTMLAAGAGELLAHDPAVLSGGQLGSSQAGSPTSPGGILSPSLAAPHDEGGSWRNSTLLGQTVAPLSDLGNAAWGTVKDLMDHGDTHDRPSQAPPSAQEQIKGKSAAALKAYQADPTNLGLYQEAMFAQAIAEEASGGAQGIYGGGGGIGGWGKPVGGSQSSSTGGGGGGSAPIVGAQGGGTWTTSSSPLTPSTPSPSSSTGGGGGGGGGLIPKGGYGLGTISGADAAALGLGTTARGAGVGGGPGGPPGASAPGGSTKLGGADPVPTGYVSMNPVNEPSRYLATTLSSGWGVDGKFQPGQNEFPAEGVPRGGSQILSSLTNLRSTASNMSGASSGLPGGADPALMRDVAATSHDATAGTSDSGKYNTDSRYLASDIQRASQSIWNAGPAAVDAYTNALADQQQLVRGPALADPTVAGAAAGPASMGSNPQATYGVDPAAPNPYPNLPMSSLMTGTGNIGSRPGTGPMQGGVAAPGAPSRYPQGSFGAPASTARQVAGQQPGGFRSGLMPGGGGSSVMATSQLDKLNQTVTASQSRMSQLSQTSNTLGQSLQKVGQEGNTAAQGMGNQQQGAQGAQASMQGLSSGAGAASTALGGAAKAAEGANAAAGGAAGGGLGAAQGGSVDTGLTGFAASVGTGASQAASVSGQAIAQSMALGMASGGGAVNSAASQLGSGATDAAAHALKSHSPSQEFYDLGTFTGQGMTLGINASMPAVAGAVTGGLNNVLDAARGVASDSGLAVGFTFIESMSTGAQQAVKGADFMKLDSPEVKSAAAKAALGAAHLIGAAGSGAQSYQLAAREVSFGSGTAARPPPPPITVNVSLDGQPFDKKIVTANNALLAEITASLKRQRDG